MDNYDYYAEKVIKAESEERFTDLVNDFKSGF